LGFPSISVNSHSGIVAATGSTAEYSACCRLKPVMRGLLAMGLLAAAAMHAAQPLRFASGQARVTLIELYTSEGCSSCPPADAWLGSLRDKPGLWSEFVPVEFHVDYWNGLGWRDRLSSRDYTDRQYAYASEWGARNVYTPCFVRNGAEWRPLWGASADRGAAAGVLSLEVVDGAACHATYLPGPGAPPSASYDIHVALLGGGVTSRVTAGENRGETLGHEFVVLGLAVRALDPSTPPREFRGTVALPHATFSEAKRRAVAAWVTEGNGLTPLQATGGWIP
jgi:hypothetical protein